MYEKFINPEKALIFRIVHKDNLPEIPTDGCRSRSEAINRSGYVQIGNQELIARRESRPVPIAPGGTLGDYIPFYFTPSSPMLYNLKTGRGVARRSMAEIVILVTSLPTLAKERVRFVFSDRHAYLKAAQFSNDLADLNGIIWEALQKRDFKREDADSFEKYQAEALVYRHLPIHALLGIVCHNEASRADAQSKVDAIGLGLTVVTRPDWYFS